MGKKFVLCGFMGSGKTSIFNSLRSDAELSSFTAVDTDQEFCRISNVGSVGEYVSQHGWVKFREGERACIVSLLEDERDLLISLGGGSLSPNVLNLLSEKEAYLIWLKVPFVECLNRCNMSNEARPLINQMSKDELLTLYNEREVLYSQSNFVIINNNLGRTKNLIKDLLIEAMKE